MSTVAIVRRAEPREPHPAWCQGNHPGVRMHRGPATVVRDRDGIKVDAYLVDDDKRPHLSLDITAAADGTLIELNTAEAIRLRTCLAGLFSSEPTGRTAAAA